MADPLSTADRDLLARAAELHRPLAKAAKIANVNGGWLMVFGGLTLLFSVFGPDFVGLAIGVFVLGAGIGERRAGERLRRADPDAPKQLARNELVLLGAIVIYGVLKLTVLRPSSEEIDKAMGGAMPGLDIGKLMDSTTTAFYALVIGVAVLYQGGMARYFTRKRADVQRFLDEVPEWARTVVEQLAN